MRLLRLPDLESQLGFSKSKIYQMISDGEFMQGYGEGRYRRWHEDEVTAYQILLWRLPDKLPTLEDSLLDDIRIKANNVKKKMLLEKTHKRIFSITRSKIMPKLKTQIDETEHSAAARIALSMLETFSVANDSQDRQLEKETITSYLEVLTDLVATMESEYQKHLTD